MTEMSAFFIDKNQNWRFRRWIKHLNELALETLGFRVSTSYHKILPFSPLSFLRPNFFPCSVVGCMKEATKAKKAISPHFSTRETLARARTLERCNLDVTALKNNVDRPLVLVVGKLTENSKKMIILGWLRGLGTELGICFS